MADKSLNLLVNAVETVSEKMDDIEDSVQEVNRSLQGMSSAFSEASGASAAFDGAAEGAADSADHLDRAVGGAARGVDKLGEDATQASAQLGFLATVMDRTSVSAGALSVNVGAFTIALRQLHTQLPLLLTTFGTLGAVTGGLTSAIVGLTVAIGTLLVGGAIAWSNQLQENFEGITSHAEAMQAIMGGLADLMEQVFAPVANIENINLLISTVERFAELANRTVQAIDSMRDSFVAFFEPINEAIDTNFNELAGAMQNMFDFEVGGEIETAGEALQRLLVFFVDRLPDAINFFNKITTQLAEPLAQLFGAFMELTRALVNFAESAGEGVLPVITMLVSGLTSLVNTLNQLDSGFVAATAQAIAFGAVAFKLLGALDSMMEIGGAFVGLLDDVVLSVGNLGDAFLAANLKAMDFFEDSFQGLTRFGEALVGTMPFLGDFSSSLDELGATGGRGELAFEDRVKSLRYALRNSLPSMDSFRNKLDSLRGGSALGEALAPDDVSFTPDAGRLQDKGGFLPTPDILTGGGPDIRGKLDNIGKRMKGLGKTALSTGKRIAMGFGNVAIGGITTFTGLVTGTLHPGLARTEALQKVVSTGLSRMSKGFKQMGLGIVPRVASSIWGMVTSLWASVTAFFANEIAAIKLAFAQKGVLAGFMQMAASAWAAVTGLIASAGSMILAAASALTLNVALGGLPLLLGAIVAGAALLVGAIGNMDGIVSGAKSSFAGLKNFAIALGNAFLNLLVPVFNVMVDIFEFLLAPVFAIVDGFGLIIDAITSAAGAGEGGASIMESFGQAMAFLGEVVSFLSPVFSVLGDILYEAFIIPFKIIAGVLGFVIGLIADLVGWLAKMAQETGFVDALLSAFDILMTGLDNAIKMFVNLVNGAIDAANNIPGVNIGKIGGGGGGGASGRLNDLKTTKAEVQDNLQKDSKEPQGQTANTTPAEFNFEENVENNTEVNARPEDSQRIKRMVEDAMEEANTFRRKKDAYSG